MHARLMDIEELFSGHHFSPAEVQRQFVWGVSECETFYNDLLDAFDHRRNEQYYLGPIILSWRNPSDSVDESVLVFDGQQRLTTLTIFMAAIAQLTDGDSASVARNLSRARAADGKYLPRLNLKTKGGALTRVVRNEQAFRRTANNMPVDWRILDIEEMFLRRLGENSDREGFFVWMKQSVLLNALWADAQKGLILFDRANNRGVKLHWYELVKSVLTEFLGEDFRISFRNKKLTIDEIWYETERATTHEFPDLISSIGFTRYRKIEAADSLSGFENEFDASASGTRSLEDGHEFFRQFLAYRRSSEKLLELYKFRSEIRSEPDLILFQLLALEYPHWKSLLMRAEELSLHPKDLLSFLSELRQGAFIAHLLGWPKWPSRLTSMFGRALDKLERSFSEGRTSNLTLFSFTTEQLSQARGELSISMSDEGAYRPLVKMWEAQQAFRMKSLDGHALYLAHVEHILPRAPRGDWCEAFSDEDERAALRNKMGNFCLLSKEDNYSLGNDQWASKRSVYRQTPKCFVGARSAAKHAAWTPEVIKGRTKEIAAGIAQLIGIDDEIPF